jgi:sugar O-acyltransferase (sialic acid O-acetyltransferase NeuD family)
MMSNHDPSARRLFGIYGASGCGRGVMPLADTMLSQRYTSGTYELVFVDDAVQTAAVNGRPVFDYERFREEPCAMRAICIAVADPWTRERLARKCADDGVEFFAVTASNVLVMDDVEIGEGGILSPFVTLTSNIRIGRHFHCNLYSYVEHDCTIGDFVTFAPGVHCNGNVQIEDYAYLGSGCIVRQGRHGEPLRIGRGAVVGMGAVVTKSVPQGVVVAGNPARILRRC